LFTIVKYTSRVYMGGQGEKPSCSRNDASSDPGVKPWLIFKELQEFKPLPFIFPFLAGKKGKSSIVSWTGKSFLTRNKKVVESKVIVATNINSKFIGGEPLS
ncbi:unnamed protein product, partial [Brassica napus]